MSTTGSMVRARTARSRAPDLAADARIVGRAAGLATVVSAFVAVTTIACFSPDPMPAAFVALAVVTVCSGVAFLATPWDRLPRWSLHAIPLVAVAETAVGIRLAGLYDDIAINYYVFVAVFAAYAFPARSVVAGYVVLLSIASALPLLYGPAKVGETAARTVVAVLLLVVVAGIVTLLREGLQRRQLELEELAVRDPLTGVGNYRLLSERLEYEIVRHRRSGEPLTVMLLDLDNFKDINDTFGHLAGDRALVEVAAALESCVRARDTVARQGGDEFSILAPETGEDAAQVLARRVQEAIVTATSGTLSASVGWATFPAGAEQSSALLALADADLWRVKRQRRTRHRSRSAPTGRPSTAGIA